MKARHAMWVFRCVSGLVLLFGVASAQAESIPCITDILGGTTIDFEQPGTTANDVLPAFDMIAAPDTPITTLVSPVTGNSCAPISDRAMFGQGFQILTTGQPWSQIGLTGVGTVFGLSETLTLTAFGMNGVELGSVTEVFPSVVFPPFTDYNAAAVFLGFSSSTPIFSIELTSTDPNVAWDDLRFSSVPEPSSLLLLGTGLIGVVGRVLRGKR